MNTDKRKLSNTGEILYRFSKNKVSLIGVAILVILLFTIIFAEQISPYQYGIKNNVAERLQGPSAKHWFGTDGYGRDIFTRVIHGAKYTMVIALTATISAQIIGAILGALAAFYTKWVDSILMRILDVFQAIMPSVASFSPHPDGSKRQSQIVHHDQEVSQLDFLTLHPITHRFATQVHVRARLQQQQRTPLHFHRRHRPITPDFKNSIGRPRKGVQHFKSDIMSCVLVFGTNIPQSHDKILHLLFPLHLG